MKQVTQTKVLGAALLVGALSLAPQAAHSGFQRESSADQHQVLFPTPAQGLQVSGLKSKTVSDVLAEFSAVTGELLMYSAETEAALAERSTQLLADLDVQPENVYSVMQDILIQNDFALVDVRREEPRILGVKDLQSPERCLIRESARFVPMSQLGDYSNDSALIISTVFPLQDLDVRMTGASLRHLVVDPNTMQILPISEGNQVLMTGLARDIHRIAQILASLDDAAGTTGERDFQEALLEAAERMEVESGKGTDN